MIEARQGHGATALQDGRVLVVGGTGLHGDLGSAEIYDPATGNWASTGGLEMQVVGATITLLTNGNVLIAGGFKPHTATARLPPKRPRA